MGYDCGQLDAADSLSDLKEAQARQNAAGLRESSHYLKGDGPLKPFVCAMSPRPTLGYFRNSGPQPGWLYSAPSALHGPIPAKRVGVSRVM